MKRKALIVLIILLVALFAVSVTSAGAKKACTPISSGKLYFNGRAVTLGVNENGFNYQAHHSSNFYTTTNGWNQVLMKWNDAWISNADCDGDYKLDRHYGFDDWDGSGAWITIRYIGEYTDPQDAEQICKWDEFAKIVAVPEDAYLQDGVYYTADGKEIGPKANGWLGVKEYFAIVHHVLNDPCHGLGGKQLNSPDRAGLGGW